MGDEAADTGEDPAPTPPASMRCDPREEPLVELVERARQGDHEAFASLFEAYNARICVYLARLVGNDEMGRDLAQDTFLAAWRALPQVIGALRFDHWLYRIATNTARAHLRRARLLCWLPFGLENVLARQAPSAEPEPGARLAEAERITLALATLGPQSRICLLLQLEGGFAQREIASALRISEKSVSAYVSRGREQFRRAYRALEHEAQQEPRPHEDSRGS